MSLQGQLCRWLWAAGQAEERPGHNWRHQNRTRALEQSHRVPGFFEQKAHSRQGDCDTPLPTPLPPRAPGAHGPPSFPQDCCQLEQGLGESKHPEPDFCSVIHNVDLNICYRDICNAGSAPRRGTFLRQAKQPSNAALQQGLKSEKGKPSLVEDIYQWAPSLQHTWPGLTMLHAHIHCRHQVVRWGCH